MTTEEPKKLDFIRQQVTDDLAAGRVERVVTRFPPEPNGYLHIGHAKAIWINYGIAEQFGGVFHLRMDDTNPMKEEAEFVEAIKQDVAWLGADWGENFHYASDYFERMYELAVDLVRAGKAYVDDQTPDEIRANRGTLTSPGVDSPYRDRTPDENLDLLERMKAGEFADGSRVLRAKIDMTSPNMNLRDPVMYRILHAAHPHRGDAWCLYPMYDWAHGLEDAVEGVTHSLCDIDFENHRPLYDWFLDAINEARDEPIDHPKQIEFARFNLTHTVTSKRRLRQLVAGGHVTGWDDPRLPTIRGMRRRGYAPEAIRDFMQHIGVSKFVSTIELALFEHFQRQHLNKVAPRVMGVLRPLKVVIENYPEGRTEQLEAINNPEDPAAGTRQVPFSRELYIERDDFMEDPPRKFFRLAPGREVRLRYAYFITCREAVKDADGTVVELRCTYDPATRGGDAPDGRKVKATLHWVSAADAVDAEARLYGHLLARENPGDLPDEPDWAAEINPDSLAVLHGVKLEPAAAGREPGWRCQFERKGYFCVDPDSTADAPVFNRTVTLRDTWKKIQKKSR
ncbi:MAG: glutamine--tRNA ligase/YqeY domain fusion protein [Phycisphaerae bacterium]|nr:glutamine--tRNA ligase/YqeY domain fusion protein [Phycisphaerae bacterium]